MKVVPEAVNKGNNPKVHLMLSSFMRGCGTSGVYRTHAQLSKENLCLAIFGVKYGQKDLFNMCDNFFYMDNGYIKNPGKKYFYRIVYNDIYFNNIGPERSPEKFNRLMKLLKIEPRPRRRDGDIIILCPPSPNYLFYTKLTVEGWIKDTTREIRKYTDRPIRISIKKEKNKVNLAKDKIWCLITSHSNMLVDALLQGIPVITTHSTKIGKISDINDPPFDHQILYNLAHQQWDLTEIKKGEAWRSLCDTYGLEYDPPKPIKNSREERLRERRQIIKRRKLIQKQLDKKLRDQKK